MVPPKKRGGTHQKPLEKILPELLTAALTRQADFILTFETNPDTGAVHVHVMTGRFVSGCMLRKLQGQAESQRDEGATLTSRKWKRV